jgi:YesN/AraC family two-component response regulator
LLYNCFKSGKGEIKLKNIIRSFPAEITNLGISSQDFNINYARTIPGERAEYYELQIHDLYEIYYFIEGDVSYHIEGHVYQVKPGDTLLINNKEMHKPVFNSQKEYERITAHFAPWYFSKYNRDDFNILKCFENRKSGYFNLIPAQRAEKYNIDSYYEQIKSYLAKEEKGKGIMLESLFVQLLYLLNKAFVKDDKLNEGSIEYNEKITKVIEYINKNLEKKFSLDDIAREFYLDKYYLSHLFKENTGFSIIQYINYKKIMKAKELLARDYSCSMVAEKLKFGNYSHFYKQFSKEVGLSPSKYQKKSLL